MAATCNRRTINLYMMMMIIAYALLEEKEGWGVYPGVGGVLLLPLFAQCVCVCSVCDGGEGEMEWLVPIILRARPVRLVSLRPCTAYSAGFICYPNAGSH